MSSVGPYRGLDTQINLFNGVNVNIDYNASGSTILIPQTTTSCTVTMPPLMRGFKVKLLITATSDGAAHTWYIFVC